MVGLSTSKIEQLFQHLDILQDYARRTVLHGETLTPEEDADRALRVRWVFSVGDALSWSEKDIVSVLYGDLFCERMD